MMPLDRTVGDAHQPERITTTPINHHHNLFALLVFINGLTFPEQRLASHAMHHARNNAMMLFFGIHALQEEPCSMRMATRSTALE